MQSINNTHDNNNNNIHLSGHVSFAVDINKNIGLSGAVVQLVEDSGHWLLHHVLNGALEWLLLLIDVERLESTENRLLIELPIIITEQCTRANTLFTVYLSFYLHSIRTVQSFVSKICYWLETIHNNLVRRSNCGQTTDIMWLQVTAAGWREIWWQWVISSVYLYAEKMFCKNITNSNAQKLREMWGLLSLCKHAHRKKLCMYGWMDGWLGFNGILSTQVELCMYSCGTIFHEIT